MIDFPLITLILMFAFVAMTTIFNVFKWGHNKERRDDTGDN